MLLGWQLALVIAVPLSAAVAIAPKSKLSTYAWDVVILLVMYAFWQWLLDIGVQTTQGAAARGTAVWNFERAVHLPSEYTIQRAALHHASWFVRFCNYFYADVHVQDVLVCLVWLYFRHRDRYREARNALAWSTLGTAFLQFIPVAPPRLLPLTHVVDAGRLLGYAIYGPAGLHDSTQTTAMPSVHVSFAVWVGIAVFRSTKSRWRWLALLDPIITVVAVIVTGYHFWADAIVSVVLVGAAYFLCSERRPGAPHEVDEVVAVEPLLGVEWGVGQ